MRNCYILLFAAVLCFCSCVEKYQDETFYRVEYTFNRDRLYYEDMGREVQRLFGTSHTSAASGAEFMYESVNDTIRRARYEFSFYPGPGVGIGTIQLTLHGYDAFFYLGQKYPLIDYADLPQKGPEDDPAAVKPSWVKINKGLRCVSGSFSFRRASERPIDRYVLCFDLQIERSSTQNHPKDTLQIKDGFLTVCRRFNDNNVYRDLILYEK